MFISGYIVAAGPDETIDARARRTSARMNKASRRKKADMRYDDGRELEITSDSYGCEYWYEIYTPGADRFADDDGVTTADDCDADELMSGS